jgi:uncharacterized protein YcaQ
MHLSHSAARALMIAAQGLDRREERPARKADLLKTIRRMGVLQIDTIHVVARSPYLVLWSRLGDYRPVWLDELLADGEIFEYWAHEACFIPIEDYPFFRRRMVDSIARSWNVHAWMESHREEVDRFIALIEERGPVRSSDFVRSDGKKSGWWEWKPEKRMLERLYTAGELMIARRHNFQRIYDLRHRVHRSWDDSQIPSLEETQRTFVLKAVRAMGIATARWIPDYYRMRRTHATPIIRSLIDEGALIPVTVEGWSEPAYIHPDNRKLAADAAGGTIAPSLTTLLSPFDPLVWDRARASAMFGFDYRIECYTPEPKRRYGYFTLPILHRDRLIGRLDPKAHRREGRFEVKSLHLEPGVVVTDELLRDLASALNECAQWHGTPDVIVTKASVPKLAGRLQRAVKNAG